MELHIQHGGRWQEPHKEAGPRARETRALQRPGSLRQGTSSLYAQGLRGHDFENYKWHCKTNRRLCIVLTSCLQSVQVTIVADQWRRHTQYRFTCCKPTNPARHHKHTDGPFTTTNTGCSFRRTDIVDKALLTCRILVVCSVMSTPSASARSSSCCRRSTCPCPCEIRYTRARE